MKNKTILQEFEAWLAKEGYYKDDGMLGEWVLSKGSGFFHIGKVKDNNPLLRLRK